VLRGLEGGDVLKVSYKLPGSLWKVEADNFSQVPTRASTQHWSPRQLLEEVARSETQDLARRSLERRLAQARLGRFKPMADFDWHWPKKIDRPLIAPLPSTFSPRDAT